MAISILEHRAAFTSKVVGEFKEVIPVRAGFTDLFPSETTPSYYVDIMVKRGSKNIAVDVKRFTDGDKTKFSISQEKKFLPPHYKLDYDYTRSDIYLSSAALGVTNSASANKAMAIKALEAVVENKDSIIIAIRKQQADVLQTGVVSIKNGDNIDYKRRSASMVDIGAGNYWTTTTNRPKDDIQAGLKFLRNTGRSSGGTVNMFMRGEDYLSMMETDQMKEIANFRRIENIEIGMPQFSELSGMTFQGRVAGVDRVVNVYTYDETYDDENGDEQYFLTLGNVVMIPSDFKGKTIFGALPAEVMSTVAGVTEMVPGIVEADFLLRGYSDRRTLSSTLELTSSPLVVPFTIDKIYTMKIS